MRDIKYVHHQDYGIFIFSDAMTHSDFVRRMDWYPYTDEEGVDHNPILGAGFVGGIGTNEVQCYGESHSLKIKCSPDCTWRLRRQFGMD